MAWLKAIPETIALINMLAAEFKKIQTAWTFKQYVSALTVALQKAHETKGDTSAIEALVNGSAIGAPPSL